MNCIITNRIAGSTTDIELKIRMLNRQRIFSGSIRERLQINAEIITLKAQQCKEAENTMYNS